LVITRAALCNSIKSPRIALMTKCVIATDTFLISLLRGRMNKTRWIRLPLDSGDKGEREMISTCTRAGQECALSAFCTKSILLCAAFRVKLNLFVARSHSPRDFHSTQQPAAAVPRPLLCYAMQSGPRPFTEKHFANSIVRAPRRYYAFVEYTHERTRNIHFSRAAAAKVGRAGCPAAAGKYGHPEMSLRERERKRNETLSGARESRFWPLLTRFADFGPVLTSLCTCATPGVRSRGENLRYSSRWMAFKSLSIARAPLSKQIA
jgi:hypothetical protein